MNCKEYMELIGDYFERRLPPEKVLAIDAHVATCPSCSEFHQTAREITCREVAEVYEYIENTLPPDKRAVFDRHFAICTDCRNYVESYRATMRLSQAALEPPPACDLPPVSEDFVRSILGRIRRP